MKAELFIRIHKIQEEKLDMCLDLLEKISKIFIENVNAIPDNVKDEYINVTRPFIEKYNTLLGEEGNYEEEEN
jgi:hypothetical protein